MFLESLHTLFRYFVPSVASSFFNLIVMFSICLHVIFAHPRPLLPTTSKSNALNTLSSLLKTYRLTSLALTGHSNVSSKPNKFMNSWLLFFAINFALLIPHVIVFSILKLSSHSPSDTTSRSRTTSPML